MAILVCAASSQVFAQTATVNGETLNVPETSARTGNESLSAAALSADDINQKIAEAKELLGEQPALKSLETVRLAVLDPQSSQIQFLSLSKDSFLLKGADLSANTEAGQAVRIKVIRANGVNTAVSITDAVSNQNLFPLIVEFPIVKGGSLKETAFYTSAHPALISDDVTASGQAYITTMLAQASASLAKNGVTVDPELVTIAEHLVVVEHTDHRRFLNEDRKSLFPEILSLYALNQNNTFNYSVSTAGAGGMIQMIPRTYEATRQAYPAAKLEPDFVKGMRDHSNALKAMLLYMHDTWNGLQRSSDVQDALRNGIATKPELMAAGYNSNPTRLPVYLKNGGATWRSLIPAETQMYLAIYASVDSNVKFSASGAPEVSPAIMAAGLPAEGGFTSVLLPWISLGLFGK